jgi:hypothetical protein
MKMLGDYRLQSQERRLGVGAVSQPSIHEAAQSGLLTHIAATQSVSLCVLMKS